MQDSSPGFILWLTGLSGAGKSTLALGIARRLSPMRAVEILDGDATPPQVIVVQNWHEELRRLVPTN